MAGQLDLTKDCIVVTDLDFYSPSSDSDTSSAVEVSRVPETTPVSFDPAAPTPVTGANTMAVFGGTLHSTSSNPPSLETPSILASDRDHLTLPEAILVAQQKGVVKFVSASNPKDPVGADKLAASVKDAHTAAGGGEFPRAYRVADDGAIVNTRLGTEYRPSGDHPLIGPTPTAAAPGSPGASPSGATEPAKDHRIDQPPPSALDGGRPPASRSAPAKPSHRANCTVSLRAPLKDDLLAMLEQGCGQKALIERIERAPGAEKRALLDDAAVRAKIRPLPPDRQIAIVDAVTDLSKLPRGAIHDAAALLLLSDSVVERNAGRLLAWGKVRAFYVESLSQPPTEKANAILAKIQRDPAHYDVYIKPGTQKHYLVTSAASTGFGDGNYIFLRGRMAHTNAPMPLDVLKTTLVHEYVHTLLPDDTSDPLKWYQVEFTAYWWSDYANVTNLDARASAVKGRILTEYPELESAYKNDNNVKESMDRFIRPLRLGVDPIRKVDPSPTVKKSPGGIAPQNH